MQGFEGGALGGSAAELTPPVPHAPQHQGGDQYEGGGQENGGKRLHEPRAYPPDAFTK
ncbi:hypothetical protein Ssi02_25460 [Sinosporangium siamense]|uniref:Uncharacterized protein n=1 Tax=Sinosporangium siamense TaxID=1367973 RepID=A0A919RGG1_9ACTN|nr:hypothetical protein Ssi02_25460 [Sinosporangium siamense]